MLFHVDGPEGQPTREVRQILMFYLSRFEQDVYSLHLDLRLPDKSDDKRCHMYLSSHLADGQVIELEERQQDHRQATQRILDRLHRRIQRRQLVQQYRGEGQ